jgi:hypothetical protein
MTMETKTIIDWLSVLLAVLYAVMGALSVALALLPDQELVLAGLSYGGDLMLGLVFLVVAGIFTVASRLLLKGDPEHLPFAYVGSGLGTLVLVIQFIVVAVDASLTMLEGEVWVLADSLHPSVLVGLLSLMAFVLYRARMGAEDCSTEVA